MGGTPKGLIRPLTGPAWAANEAETSSQADFAAPGFWLPNVAVPYRYNNGGGLAGNAG